MTARDIGAPGRDPYGAGLLDAAAALATPAAVPTTPTRFSAVVAAVIEVACSKEEMPDRR